MKKIALLVALLMLPQATVLAASEAVPVTSSGKVNYNLPYYYKTSVIQGKKVEYAPKNSQVYKNTKGNDYILKYNIDDLESAPWLNGGKRKI